MNLIKRINQQTIIFVHTKNLLYQWADRVEEVLGVEPNIIGDDNFSEGPITIATMQTLHQRGVDTLEQEYGVAIFDECHKTTAADTMNDIGLDIEVQWRIGLSATPWRATPGGAMEIEAVVGGMAFEVSAEDLIEKGYLAEPEFEFLSPDGLRTANPRDSYWDTVRRCIELDPVRNGAIAEKAAELADSGHTVFVSVDRLCQGRLIEHALAGEQTPQELSKELIESDDDKQERREKKIAAEEIININGYNVAFLEGDDSMETREQTIDEFQNGDIDIIVSTLLKEGVDIPEISAIVHGEAGKSKIEKIQRVGRALRPSGGETAQIVDIKDEGKHLADHYKKRLNLLKDYYGEYGPDNGFSPKVKAVRDYLKENGVNIEACRVEEQDDGSVTIELVDYLGGDAFSTFRNATQKADGISYDGNKNNCEADWVESLVA